MAQRRLARKQSGYEYAAGDVVLPFSYSATRSPAPKPDNLDFSHQVSPDNCEVFIRIDDELWEFRSQWVVNLGTTARYKGPDIDHMTRVRRWHVSRRYDLVLVSRRNVVRRVREEVVCPHAHRA